MPFYAYECAACHRRFEELVPSMESAAPPCPACQAEGATRVPTGFAVGRASVPMKVSAPPGCGTCGDPRGPGACQMG